MLYIVFWDKRVSLIVLTRVLKINEFSNIKIHEAALVRIQD